MPKLYLRSKNFRKLSELNKQELPPEATWKAINLILAKRIIRVNHAGGPVVRYLQHHLGVEVNGVYGSQIHEAIRKFPQQNSLLADGIIGPLS